MAWQDSFDSIAGVYNNGQIPQVNLDHYSDVVIPFGNGIIVNDQQTCHWYDDPQWEPAWGDADGLWWNRMNAKSEPNPGVSGVKLFEIPIKNPQGAQFYKQTLALYGSLYYDIRTLDPDVPITQRVYHVSFSDMKRIQYDTPYDDTPTVEHIATLSTSNMEMNIEGGSMTDAPDEYQTVQSLIGFSPMHYNGDTYWCFYLYSYSESFHYDNADQAWKMNKFAWFSAFGLIQEELDEIFGGNFEPEEGEQDPNLPPDDPEQPPSGPSQPDYPPHETPQDPIPIPPKPPIGAGDAGFLTLYHLNAAEMFVFGQDCFASDVWEAIRLFFSNPIDFIAGCNLLPFSPPGNSMWHPKFGLKAFQHAYARVEDEYYDVDCGTIVLNEYWQSFLDYEPYTRMLVWLPYIGYRELPVDDVMGGTLHIMYRCNCLTGDCVAFLERSGRRVNENWIGPTLGQVFAQYSGNCAVRVPFASVSFDAAIQASVNLLTCGASTAIASAPSSTTTQSTDNNGEMTESIVNSISGGGNIAGIMGAAVDTVLSMKPEVQRGGAVGATGGQMSIQKPHIIIVRPRRSLPEDFKKLKGYPLNASGTLSQLGSGYAEVEDIQLNNIPAMMTERQEIVSMLRKGVII